jgi:hypothetical protein
MTAATKIERSGPAIRAALAELSADECTQFGAEFEQALGHAAETFDLAPVDAVLDRWWGIAAIRVETQTAMLACLLNRPALSLMRSHVCRIPPGGR